MKVSGVTLTMLCTLSFPALAAECSYPAAPTTVPNGKSATEAEMLTAMTALRKFNDAVAVYLVCLDAETDAKIKAAGDENSLVVEVIAAQSKKRFDAVSDLRTIARKFNDQARAFKARSH